MRGYDVRTGKRLWIFHTIPRPGEFGYDTWEEGSEEYTGNTGVWAQMSVDEELGLVYLPVEMPTGDYYGGHRPGDGLFGESLVARRSEDRQAQVALPVHPARHLGLGPAVRADPRRRRRSTAGCVKIVAQPTKQGWLYVFDRATGEPIWPIEERPVEQSDVPGEIAQPDAAVRHQAAAVRAPGRVASTT